MFGFGKKEAIAEDAPKPDITLQEVIDNFNVVDVNQDFMVVSERSDYELSEDSKPRMGEIGGIGGGAATSYGRMVREDYNPAMQGYMGYRKYDQMRKSDGQVKSTLRLAKTPILAGSWWVQPAGKAPKDKMIADYVWNCLTKWGTTSWAQLLEESLLMLDFGYYAFEKVFAYNPEPRFRGKLIWSKFSPRHPQEVSNWEYDANGGPSGIWYTGTPSDAGAQVFISIKKLLVFTHEKEAGNMQGVSILRPAYKHFYFKDNLYKVDGIQKERHGIGIPIIKLPPSFTPEDKRLANELGSNLRTNEKAHVVLPPMWEIMFAKLEGQPVDCLTSIEHHDKMIEKVILATMAGETTGQDLFIKSTRSVAEGVRDAFNMYAIPQLVNYNWANVTDYPQLRFRRIGENQDLRTWSFALRNFVGAGLITPDEPLEAYIRSEMDLPEFDPTTARAIATPQNPNDVEPGDDEESEEGTGEGNEPGVRKPTGKQAPGNEPGGPNAQIGKQAPQPNKTTPKPRVGLPRQSPASGMKQQARGTGKSNTGRDSSGG